VARVAPKLPTPPAVRPRSAARPPAPPPAAAPPAPAATPTAPRIEIEGASPAEIAGAPQPQAAPVAGTTAFSPQTIAIPEPSRLRYEVTAQTHGLTLGGEARFQWRHDGTHYEARLEVSSPGLPARVQRSEGRITDEGLSPSYFSDKSRSEQATHFDRDRGRLVFSNNQPEAALQVGMQDRLSVIVQLAVLIAGQPDRFPAGTQIAIPTASTREAETWIFSVEGEEDLRLPGGDVRAIKLQRLPRKPYDQKVELWLAPRMDYAPVRLRLTNPNGDAVDQRWSATDRG
jgi:hypothetical protein